MCGIVGMVTTQSNGFLASHKKIFKQLLFADTLRGDDSTGVFGVRASGNVDYVKSSKAAPDFLSTKEYDEFENQIFMNYRMCVGHNRKATRGLQTDENAHPFEESNTILVHNGTITNQYKLTKKITQVDSHAILHSIVERGEVETLAEIEGAFTLVWYNTEEKILKVIRNEERPLFIANTEDAWYFASEEGMLRWILERENEKICSMISADVGKLYSFKLDDISNMWIKPMKLYKRKPHITLVAEKQPEEPSTKQVSNTEASLFKCGSHILVSGTRLVTLKGNKRERFLIEGNWFYDKEIPIRCWMGQDTLESLSDPVFTGEKDKDEVLFRAEITQVITHKGNITLVCNNATPYIPLLDLNESEILEDDYLYTDGLCSHCAKPTPFKSLVGKGVFKFTTEEDFETICPDCCSKEKHITP